VFRRLIRFVLASAALGGAGFAVFKVVQSRKSGGAGMPSGDESIMPTRSEAPLVQPSLMEGLDLRKTATAESDDRANGSAPLRAETPAVEVSTPPLAEAAPGPGAGWVEPEADGACPDGYPIKAKLASGIFHVPGMLAYDRTTPDRCYRDEASAEADGLRKAKR